MKRTDSPASITAGTYSSLFTDAVNQVAPILAGNRRDPGVRQDRIGRLVYENSPYTRRWVE